MMASRQHIRDNRITVRWDGSKPVGALRSMRYGAATLRRALLTCSANRPESSGGPLVTDYLSHTESSRAWVDTHEAGLYLSRSNLPTRPLPSSLDRSDGPIVTGFPSSSEGSRVKRDSSCYNLPVRPLHTISPGGPKRIGYPRFESRRAVQARCSKDVLRQYGVRGKSARDSHLAHLTASPRT